MLAPFEHVRGGARVIDPRLSPGKRSLIVRPTPYAESLDLVEPVVLCGESCAKGEEGRGKMGEFKKDDTGRKRFDIEWAKSRKRGCASSL